MILIELPIHWETKQVIYFVNKLWSYIEEEEVLIDLTKVEFVRPFGVILIAESLRLFIEQRGIKGRKTHANIPRFETVNYNSASSYLMHVGFFTHIGVNNAGNKPNEASGSDRYLPITIIDRRQLFEDGSSLRIQDAIEIKSEQLANVLDSNSTSQKMLSYCFREVIRNVFEHAQVNECVFMAQKYPNDNTVEIVILDKGIGIFHSLTSRYRDLLSVDQALNKCIEPGISRVAKSYIQDEWTNTGFGLYVLSSLGRSAGKFLICSNRRFLNLYNNLPPDIGGISFDGTVIQLIIKLHNVVQFPILLQKIVDEGVRLCKSKTGMNQNVSAKSKMVR